MARTKKVMDEITDVVFYYDSEDEIIEQAKTKGFNGVEYLPVGDDTFNTARATIIKGNIIRWSVVDDDGETVGVCGSYDDAVLYLKGKDVNEYYGNND